MIKKVTAKDGTIFEYDDKIIGRGGMKTVHLTTDNKNVIAFYHQRGNFDFFTTKYRLETIINTFNSEKLDNWDYWKEYFCWPTHIIEDNGQLGIVMPKYPEHFRFKESKMKGKEKEGRWFSSAKLRKFITNSEKGNWQNYFYINIKISRAIRRLHASGFAHSDLSSKNILIDPKTTKINIIDIDGLVVPNRFPPDVAGTKDYMAPEIFITQNLKIDDPNKNNPNRNTDLHSLAVLIYMYLLYRHPLKGKLKHIADDDENDKLCFGEKALFIENSNDKRNISEEIDNPDYLPWADTNKLPYTITGPYVSPLIKKAFEDGLHNPKERPSADEWERALLDTLDLLIPCKNKNCEQKWFVYDDNKKVQQCPFCNTKYPKSGKIPVLYYSSMIKKDNFSDEGRKLIVYNGLQIFKWHLNKFKYPNERFTDNKRVGYFSFHNNKWMLANENIENLKDTTDSNNIKEIDKGKAIPLRENQILLLSNKEKGDRTVCVKFK